MLDFGIDLLYICTFDCTVCLLINLREVGVRTVHGLPLKGIVQTIAVHILIYWSQPVSVSVYPQNLSVFISVKTFNVRFQIRLKSEVRNGL